MNSDTQNQGEPREPDKVIDLEKVRARASVKQARKRKKRLLVVAAVALVLLLIGAFLWFQVSEVFAERTFWENLGQAASGG